MLNCWNCKMNTEWQRFCHLWGDFSCFISSKIFNFDIKMQISKLTRNNILEFFKSFFIYRFCMNVKHLENVTRCHLILKFLILSFHEFSHKCQNWLIDLYYRYIILCESIKTDFGLFKKILNKLKKLHNFVIFNHFWYLRSILMSKLQITNVRNE